MRSTTKTRWKARLARHPRLFWLLRRLVRGLRAWRSRLFGETSFWDVAVDEAESDRPGGWMDLEIVEREYIRPQVTGDANTSYLEYFVEEHLPRRPVDLGLSLGCGGGHLERALLDLGAAERMVGLDASSGSIELARRLAREAGHGDEVDYRVADLDRAELAPASYDFVVAKMSLHHLSNLEHVYDQVAQALRPGAPFLVNEYVGADRFQWTDRQLALANEWLEELPDSIRRRVPVPRIRRPTVAEMLADDPTESVRSSEVMPLLRERFEIVEERPYGGTVLHPLLAGVLPAFDLENAEHREALRGWMEAERQLVASGELPSDFVFAVAVASR